MRSRTSTGRQLFTLSPTKLASALPEVDFAPVTNGLLREKLESDWGEVQRCVAHHLHSSLITAAKNVAESLVVFALGAPQKNLRLEKALEELGGRLRQGQPTRLQFNFLDYHLLSKLRILHAGTHADRVVIDGRLVDPEFALTVVHDLVQVLRSTGLAR